MGIRYEGFFVSDDLVSTLNKDIRYKHVTTEYLPKRIHPHLYGKEAIIYITGYANDGKNEGVSVKLGNFVADDELTELFNQIENPHITLSVGSNCAPADTGKLIFTKNSNLNKFPSVLICKFGAFDGKPIFSLDDN